MKKALLLIAFILPVMFLQAQTVKEKSPSKSSRKEIPASRLPKKVTTFISPSLPNAKITKVIKQKGRPEEKYIVSLSIKTKAHVLIFSNKGDFVRVIKSRKK